MADQPALTAAARSRRPVVPVFVMPSGGRQPGGAGRWWLHYGLAALEASLREAGLVLILRRGDPAAALKDVARACGAGRLYFNRAFDPDTADAERRVTEALGDSLEITAFAGDALQPPGSIRTAAGQPFRVFTPFWRGCLAGPEPPVPEKQPGHFKPASAAAAGVATESLADWRLRPARPDWASGLSEAWRPGHREASRALARFIDAGMADYPTARDRPDQAGTSRLSPHLHFGEISPRQVWHAVRSRAAGDSRLAAGADAFLRQLGWREFSLHLLHALPALPTQPLQADFERFPWRTDGPALRAWQRGETGYPLVDAGMRELWATGWMHNRVRMVTASFLVKHLLIHWREGEAWFWDTLVDADTANNAASWQWVAGCGADAAPWFRVFNPVLQGTKFDPTGAYVRRWLPELARLPDRFIHAPWTATEAVLCEAGVRLGRNYPAPIVAHAAARERALTAYAAMRSDKRASAVLASAPR